LNKIEDPTMELFEGLVSKPHDGSSNAGPNNPAFANETCVQQVKEMPHGLKATA